MVPQPLGQCVSDKKTVRFTTVLPTVRFITVLYTIGTFFGNVNAGTTLINLGVRGRACLLYCFPTAFNCDFNRNLVLNCVANAAQNGQVITFCVRAGVRSVYFFNMRVGYSIGDGVFKFYRNRNIHNGDAP